MFGFTETKNEYFKMTMGDLYDRTIEKKKYFEDNGFIYSCIWNMWGGWDPLSKISTW